MRSGPQPRGRRLAGEPIAGDRRDHDVERVLCAAAVGRRVGERADDVQQLDDRAGPAVDEDQRQRVLVRRADVDEVDVEASISVTNCGRAFSLDSNLRKSYSVPQ